MERELDWVGHGVKTEDDYKEKGCFIFSAGCICVIFWAIVAGIFALCLAFSGCNGNTTNHQYRKVMGYDTARNKLEFIGVEEKIDGNWERIETEEWVMQ